MNKEIINDNLYEIPSCTICLSELVQDLANLACGHVFHINCITQHFQYRGSCPNCQKRSNTKEIRQMHFPLLKNNQSSNQLRELISNLDHSQKNQVQGLLTEIKKVSERNQKYKKEVEQYQKQVNQKKKQINDITTQFNRKKSESQLYRKQLLELKKIINSLSGQIKTLNQEDLRIRSLLSSYQQKQKQFERLKSLKKIMNQNAQELIKYKQQLESLKTAPQQMARQFFQMIQLKHMELRRIKQKIESFPEKIADKDDQINKLKTLLAKQKKQKQNLLEKRGQQKKKYEQLKGKYKKLFQRYKTKTSSLGFQNDNDNQMLFLSNFNEDSQGFGTSNSISRGEFPQKTILNSKQAQIKTATGVGFGKMTIKSEDSSIDNTKQNNYNLNKNDEEDKEDISYGKYKDNKVQSNSNLLHFPNQKNKSLLNYFNLNGNTKPVFNNNMKLNNDFNGFMINNFNKSTSVDKMIVEQKQDQQNLNQKKHFNEKGMIKQTQLNFGGNFSKDFKVFTGAGGGFKKKSEDFPLMIGGSTMSSTSPFFGKNNNNNKPSMKNLMM